MKINRIIKFVFTPLFVLVINFGWSDDVTYSIGGRAWTDMGSIINSKDSLIASEFNTLNLNNNRLFGMGAQITLKADFSDNCRGAFGFGARRINHSLGNDKNSFLSIAMFQSFLTESNVSCSIGELGEGFFGSWTIGQYQYKYNRNVNNLGLYLLRGPVYPGLLMGGWDDFYADDSKAPFLGGHGRLGFGGFTLDAVLNSERDLPPTFDWSLAFIGQYDFGGVAQIGLGVNFYRLIAYNDVINTPGNLDSATLNYDIPRYVDYDPITGATTIVSHQGTKVSSFFGIDLKPLFGIEEKNRDLTFYTELALIGVKDYGLTYGDKAKRIPIMFGFNLPTFGLLDLLSLELEWYGSPYKNDLAKIGNNNGVADWTRQNKPIPSPMPLTLEDYGITTDGQMMDNLGNPVVDGLGNPVILPPFYTSSFGDTIYVTGTSLDVENLTTDDWKWSVNIEKIVKNHISFYIQIASDHYRPRPYATGLITSAGGTATAFNNTNDWYLMFRTSILF